MKLSKYVEKYKEHQKDEGKEWDSDNVFRLIRIEERLKKLKDHPDSNISSLVKEILGEK